MIPSMFGKCYVLLRTSILTGTTVVCRVTRSEFIATQWLAKQNMKKEVNEYYHFDETEII